MNFCVFTGERSDWKNVPDRREFEFCNPLSRYWINQSAIDWLKSKELNLQEFSGHPPTALKTFNTVCMAKNIKANNEGKVLYWRTDRPRVPGNDALPDKVESVYLSEISEIINHALKPEHLLSLIYQRVLSGFPFDRVELNKKDALYLQMTGTLELSQWAQMLGRKGWLVESSTLKSHEIREEQGGKISVRLTPEGLEKIAQIQKGIHSNKVFIAMAFDESDPTYNRANIENAIKKACAETGGWEALTVDKNPEQSDSCHNTITNKIIADITQSAFVVAEFTKNSPGVYYEAGYAEGLGRPIIYVVHKDHLNGLHFDTKNISHIIWENTVDLCEKLKNYILARPHYFTNPPKQID